MIRKMLATMAILILGVVNSKAISGTSVYDVVNDSVTVSFVSISSYTSAGTRQLFTAQLVGATTSFTTVLENRKFMEIQNLNVSTGVFCMLGLSAASAYNDMALTMPVGLSTTTGRYIAPYGVWTLPLAARNVDSRVFVPWCVNNGGTGTTSIAIVQGRSK